MKRTVKWFAIAGGLVPFVLMCTKFLELYFNDQTVPISSIYGFYLWPSSIILHSSPEGLSFSTILGLFLSVSANVIMYGLVGAISHACFSVFPNLLSRLRVHLKGK